MFRATLKTGAVTKKGQHVEYVVKNRFCGYHDNHLDVKDFSVVNSIKTIIRVLNLYNIKLMLTYLISYHYIKKLV